MTPTDRIAELEAKLGQAYQIIGVLLSGADGNDPAFDSEDGQAILSYFSGDGYVADLLPWAHPRTVNDEEGG
ncbi:hypothetical protein FF80_01884 [Devosia sp. LC5]|uniref:hypothetical protein n=1 Tax=Devosia sp. LC5 TaxID=1502724 RepID=UPI0004E37891|nr:hypothetical protein [Devosia sp. LC5]KFC68444.1 hypothetical protein FF80_01884 [Devosia sp. LC5]